MGYEALATIIRAALSLLSHLVYYGLNNLLLSTNLVAGYETALEVHVHERTNVKYGTDRAGCLGDTTASDKEGEV